MARIVGGTTLADGIGNLHWWLVNNTGASVLNPSTPIERLYFGLKDSSLNLPETTGTKFIGMGIGETVSTQLVTKWNGSTYGNWGSANSTGGISFGSSQNGMRYGLSNGTLVSSILKSAPAVATAPNFRIQPCPNNQASGTQQTPATLFCSAIGFIIKVQNRGTEAQTVSIFNYGSQVRADAGNGNYDSTFRCFTDISESILNTELSIMNANYTAHSGGLTHTFNAPHSQYDLSGIDSFFIYWPFTQNRLILFTLKVKDYTI
jgi:hypothetical protein